MKVVKGKIEKGPLDTKGFDVLISKCPYCKFENLEMEELGLLCKHWYQSNDKLQVIYKKQGGKRQ